MTGRGAMVRLAGVLAAVTAGLAAGGAVLQSMAPAATGGYALFQAGFALAGTAFAGSGYVVIRFRTTQPIGWLLLAVGLLGMLSNLGQGYGLLALPGASWVAWVSGVFADTAIQAVLIGLFLLFPDGRPPTPRWRWVLVVAVALTALQILGSVALPGVLDDLGTVNPLAVAALQPLGPVVEAMSTATAFLGLVAVASLVVRHRREDQQTRAQLRLFAVAASFLIASIVVSFEFPDDSWAAAAHGAVFLVALWLVPASIAVAVLRYRLYEIDRIISRTATYAVVTAVLALLYGLVAVVPAAVFDLDSDLLVAAATLVAAAAFRPVRRTVQRWVDRRFDRARYDAERVVAGFGGELRDELSLGDLRGSLVGAIRRAIHPAHVSVWLPEERVR